MKRQAFSALAALLVVAAAAGVTSAATSRASLERCPAASAISAHLGFPVVAHAFPDSTAGLQLACEYTQGRIATLTTHGSPGSKVVDMKAGRGGGSKSGYQSLFNTYKACVASHNCGGSSDPKYTHFAGDTHSFVALDAESLNATSWLIGGEADALNGARLCHASLTTDDSSLLHRETTVMKGLRWMAATAACKFKA